MPDIVTAGEILVEIMTQNVGQTFLAPGPLIGPFPSGAPAIFIDQAARMGASCGIISVVGDDDFGRLNLERLKKDGVDVSEVRTASGHTTGTAFVTYFEDGSRRFVFHFADAAPGRMCEDDVNPAYFEGCKYFHVMGCSISATHSMREAVLKAARAAKSCGAKLSFDPNIRKELLGDKRIDLAFKEICAMADIMLTGRDEIMLLLDKQDMDEVLGALSHMDIIALKSGSKGVVVYHSGREYTSPPFDVSEVDPTGAGDCFDGAFLACLAEGMDVEAATHIANAAGALSVTKKGPMEGAHSKEDVLRLASTSETFRRENNK